MFSTFLALILITKGEAMIEIMSKEDHEKLHKTSLQNIKDNLGCYEETLPTETVTLDTRHDSHESLDKEKRYKQILEIMAEHLIPLTAKEIAVFMHNKGYIPTTERNFSAPRLTELSQKGVVEPVGKKKCDFTGKMVSVYILTNTECQ